MNDNKNMINFDSNDWDTIVDTINKIKEIGEIQIGKTSDGETIIFDLHVTDDDVECLKTTVIQNNHWIRTNIYNPDDGTIEETYKREDQDY